MALSGLNVEVVTDYQWSTINIVAGKKNASAPMVWYWTYESLNLVNLRGNTQNED